ncbi:TonB-dependent receptor [Novosphingobium mangrovi (ex Huang et al. 2023)]|uniref:TonB-dependent receptor n=1 Tax=Novosphingobium mangrovi (ex Huang et al. 2023) TaxID=2976432 RepID=A0ABT2I962_9SPHN|nr:TonB-dependent receptor [Novosphingobium mangrovi (ex Huang et al. 2023)]MCT2401364.1 TonB-dependent receptor [Novosphingobium mangrovi (ex Huang et al. 2023)]
MKTKALLLLATACILPAPAMAADEGAVQDAAQPAEKRVNLMTTGVARARDRLDSATSTSTLSGDEIEKYGARSVAEIFRNIPGMRAESTGGEGFASISIRGLPIALGGAKFLQIQENGLPTLEFGDMAFATADQFLRADLNLAGVQAIRGGSASTFASNSSGGIVNLIDKTGEVAGGSVQISTGLDYDSKRMDFEYGTPVSDTLRFHIGGFYRKGEGPRDTGFDGFKGGQIKFNMTKDFDGGYFRVYAKVLDDQTVPTPYSPVLVSGTNADPDYANVPGLDVSRDSLFSRYIPSNLTLDGENRVASHPFDKATHSKMKSIGFETKFEVEGWRINDKFRYSDISGSTIQPYTLSNANAALPFQSINSAPAIMAMLSATSLSYATGPNAGQTIADPSVLNGNGLLALVTNQDVSLNSLNNMTNDIRASKVWEVGAGKLTFTAGYYKSSQDIDTAWTWTTTVNDVLGGGKAHLIDVFAGPYQLTQNGVLAYNAALIGGYRRDRYDVNYDIDAPYGSLNYMFGKFALGASMRYDMGSARGTLYGSSLPGTAKSTTYDINGDGTISLPETKVGFIDYSKPAPVHYDYHYLSYSVSMNYRMAEHFSLFGRYSKGARANADRILFASYVSPTTGKLLVPSAAYDPVRQAEGGFKYRTDNLEAYVTGFWAKTREHNIGLDRAYRAYGVELETSYRRGIFAINGGATWTKAEITADALDPTKIGNTPRHQADLIFQVTPQVETERLTVGANFYGTTGSYAGDSNQLKMPGYVVTNAFVQYRPNDRVSIMLNANNLFDVLGLVDVDAEFIPSSGVVTARTINPRTVSASLRFNF